MALPDCSYVNIDDLAHPNGTDYLYCLQAEMRAMKDRMYNALVVAPLLSSGVLPKAANYTVQLTDRGKLIDYTDHSYNLQLPVPATAGNGFVIGVRNSSTGVIVIQTAGNNIDGLGELTLKTKASCLVVCDGTTWKTVGLSNTIDMWYCESDTTYTTNQAAWPKPTGEGFIEVRVVGGGGAGAGSNSPGCTGFPGASAVEATGSYDIATLAATTAITIGAGGVATYYYTTSGGGGESSFGTLIKSKGGNGGNSVYYGGDPVTCTLYAAGGAGAGTYLNGATYYVNNVHLRANGGTTITGNIVNKGLGGAGTSASIGNAGGSGAVNIKVWRQV